MKLKDKPSKTHHKDALQIVLVRTRNPLNIGTVARAMANFGYSKLRLVSPYDVAFREARSAVGASEILKSAEVYDSIADAVADCRFVIGTTAGTNRQPRQIVESLPQAALSIHRAADAGTVAVVFGSEKRGLGNDDLSYCHSLLQISTAPEYPSMNLAQSVVVVLYELTRREAQSVPGDSAEVSDRAVTANKADMQSLHRLVETMREALILSGYAKADTEPTFEEKLRRLALRMQLSQSDAETCTAMFRQILWKIGQDPRETR